MYIKNIRKNIRFSRHFCDKISFTQRTLTHWWRLKCTLPFFRHESTTALQMSSIFHKESQQEHFLLYGGGGGGGRGGRGGGKALIRHSLHPFLFFIFYFCDCNKIFMCIMLQLCYRYTVHRFFISKCEHAQKHFPTPIFIWFLIAIKKRLSSLTGYHAVS